MGTGVNMPAEVPPWKEHVEEASRVACQDEQESETMNRPVVARATSSDDSPVPGYLYGEIAQMTHANFEGCRQLTVYLLERIKKPNHNIKFKCLQIIKVRRGSRTKCML